MQGDWRSFAFPDVSGRVLSEELGARGIEWSQALHVTATSSLAAVMRSQKALAITLRDLIDVVVWAGMSGELHVPVTEYPALSEPVDVFSAERRQWAAALSGRQIRLGVQANHRLRRALDVAGDIKAGSVLRKSVTELRRSIQTLAAAGIKPKHVDRSDRLTKTALEAWDALEHDLEDLFRQREDLWIDAGEFESSTTREAKELHARLEATFDHLLGGRGTRTKIVYHGFYFFTAPQWAWFQLLQNHPGVDQYFVLHDDGTNRAFEIWREFFVERWGMPVAESVDRPTQPTAGAMIRDALEGRRVETAAHSARVRLVEYSSVTEFAADISARQAAHGVAGQKAEALFAANTTEVDRLIRRFAFAGSSDRADLAELPIGQFLLALHGCVEALPENSYRLVITADRLVDMVASGLLDLGAASDPSRAISAIRRAMPFFRDLSLLQDWVNRAEVLERLIISDVSKYGLRSPRATDEARIAGAAANPLRLAPWCDLTETEARIVVAAIRNVARIADQVIASEARNADNYIGWLRNQLDRGMKQLPEELRTEIETRIRGAGLGGDVLDVEGVIEVVNLLLGRQAEFGLDGESDDPDAPVKELRNLDALGFARSSTDIHLTNLVETAFPSRVTSIGWPFDRRCLDLSPGVPTVSREIMRKRDETAAMSDLYLLWLALEGIGPERQLTLSWTKEVANDQRNPSPLVMLVAEVDAARGGAVSSAVGGLAVNPGVPSGALPADLEVPDARSWPRDDEALRGGVDRVHPIAAASAFACARRFALQWAMGPTTGFQSAHNQLMLFGNIQGALEKNHEWGSDREEAQRVTKDLWRQYTRGQRMSSYKNRVVKPGRSARWQWLFTLGGKKDGEKPIDRAYTAAIDGTRPDPKVVAPGDGVLPGGASDVGVCRSCPVRPRCAVAVHE